MSIVPDDRVFEIDYDLDSPADVFIASKAGRMGYPTVLWRMSTADAMKVCSHPDTAGQNWMLCWTARELIDDRWFATDDGRFDALLEDLGVTVLGSKKLAKAGVKAPTATQKTPKPEAGAQMPLFPEVS